ncbi:hypothetical protein AYO20_06020 [Fonsecaea nubica]|uniref:Uncharacterized protein n=1 Tax=Fonsecaea nubica TaxID=856822 RepID=A0A178CZP2_9EURO|nr:hypothetical protein AYO20_06020 [Fonsecaea nubica]OAL34603.1 hypothetical protein AYO20_06020 [Fonsecaea nubica]
MTGRRPNVAYAPTPYVAGSLSVKVPKALTVLISQITFDAPVVIGKINSGSQLYIALINAGTLKSEPGFEPAVDAQVLFGTDHFKVTEDMKYVTIDVKAALKNEDGTTISYAYTGHIEITPAFGLILAGSPDAKTTDFGHVFTHITFEVSCPSHMTYGMTPQTDLMLETGAPNFKSLETGRFVGASRFIVNGEGKGPVIETKISKIVKG